LTRRIRHIEADGRSKAREKAAAEDGDPSGKRTFTQTGQHLNQQAHQSDEHSCRYQNAKQTRALLFRSRRAHNKKLLKGGESDRQTHFHENRSTPKNDKLLRLLCYSEVEERNK